LRLIEVAPHVYASGPALAVVGFLLKVMLVLLVDAVHAPFPIDHLIVYAVPAVPENVDVGLDAFPNDPPAPLTTLQVPEPTLGELPAKVTEVKPHVATPV